MPVCKVTSLPKCTALEHLETLASKKALVYWAVSVALKALSDTFSVRYLGIGARYSRTCLKISSMSSQECKKWKQ